jgi:hypothetical protein
MGTRKTPAAADELGVPYTTLMSLLRYRKIKPPSKDSSGDFQWTDADIKRAREALAAKREAASA